MHNARIERSKRLQRVDNLLADGQEYSTMDIVKKASVCAVNSIVSELRANGRAIACRRTKDVWFYRRTDIENAQ